MIECLFLGIVLLTLFVLCAWLERRDRVRNGPEPGAVRKTRTIFILRAALIALAVPCLALAAPPPRPCGGLTNSYTWDPTETNVDGSACVDLSGYRFYAAAEGAGEWSLLLELAAPPTPPIAAPLGVIWYAVSAVTSNNVEGPLSSALGITNRPPAAPGALRPVQ